MLPDLIVLLLQDIILSWTIEIPIYIRNICLVSILSFILFCGYMLLHLKWRNRLTGKPEQKLAVTDPYTYFRHLEYSSESWALLSIFLVSSAIMIPS